MSTTPSTRRGPKTGTGRARPNVLGTVRREQSGRFRASYRVDGVTHRAPATFGTEKDAQAWLAAEHGARKAGTWVDPRQGQTLLADYARTWLATRTDLAPRTRDLYEDLLRRWILSAAPGTDLGRYELGAVTPAVIRGWYGQLLTATRQAALHRHAAPRSRAAHPARAWAAAQGLDVPRTGRLSPALLTAWQAAGSPRPAPAARAVPEEVREQAGRSAAARAYQLVRTILHAAVEDGLLAANPCTLRKAAIVAHPERPVLSAAEVDALAAGFPAHLHAAVLTAAWSGLRSGELFALARRHVDLEAGTLRVERALVRRSGHPITFGPTKTARSRRTVHLPGFVLDLLRAHLAHHVPIHPDALLFASRTGRPLDNSQVSRYMIRARAGIGRPDVHWHDLRHVGATFAYKVGASTREVMDRLGHTTTAAALIYAHAAQDADQLLAARLDAAYQRTLTPTPPAPPARAAG